jgi:FkbM family methyltransferase
MLSTAAKIRIARMLYFLLHALRHPFGGRDEVVVRRKGLVWNLDLREGIDLTIYALGAFEPDTLRALESLVKKGATVLDVGANVGAHTLHMARLVGPKGRVIAFEPTDYAIAKLRANLQANPELTARVDVHQAFLAEQAGAIVAPSLASSWPVDGTRPDDAQMGSRTKPLSGATATTLDSVLEASGGPEVGLIKMDVDGHELEVLQGAQAVLSRCRPIIVMELAPYVFHPPGKFDLMVNLLVRAKYAFRPIGWRRIVPEDPDALRRLIPAGGSMNVVAFPAGRDPGPG